MRQLRSASSAAPRDVKHWELGLRQGCSRCLGGKRQMCLRWSRSPSLCQWGAVICGRSWRQGPPVSSHMLALPPGRPLPGGPCSCPRPSCFALCPQPLTPPSMLAAVSPFSGTPLCSSLCLAPVPPVCCWDDPSAESNGVLPKFTPTQNLPVGPCLQLGCTRK